MLKDDILQNCEKAINYYFHDRRLLKRALTHASLRSQDGACNERLEFLGDAILGLIVSEFLFHTFRDFDEGDLSLIKSTVVSRSTLAKRAEAIDLQDFFAYASGVKVDEKSSKDKKLPSSVLANVFEAIIGAIYIDGGLVPTQEFVLNNLREEIETAIKNPYQQNYKTLLQFISQKYLGATPSYKVSKTNNSSDKAFQAHAVIGKRKFVAAFGSNKKEAEQLAAHSALQILSLEDAAIAEYVERTLGKEENYSTEAPISQLSNLFQNSKSLLQHVSQKFQLSSPIYKRLHIGLEQEKKFFYISVSLPGRLFPEAKATRVKDAERLAARTALQYLAEDYYSQAQPIAINWQQTHSSPAPVLPDWYQIFSVR